MTQCSRCRKRKIRCSGDNGDGQACINCKNSNMEHECRFLRVSSGIYALKKKPQFLTDIVCLQVFSSEAQMRTEFEYNLTSARKHQIQPISVVQPIPTPADVYQDDIVVPTTEAVFYRNNAVYLHGSRYQYPLPGWNPEFVTEDGLMNYPICSQPCTTAGTLEAPFMIPYPAIESSPFVKQLKSPDGVYTDASTSYNYGCDDVTTMLNRVSTQENFVNDSHPMAALIGSLPPGLTIGAERMLIAPTHNRSMPASGLLSTTFRAGSLPSTYGKSSQTPNDAASPSSPLIELPGSYASYTGSPLSAYTPSATSAVLPSQPPYVSDHYTTSPPGMALSSPDGLLRNASSVPDLAYRYMDSTVQMAKSGSNQSFISASGMGRHPYILRSQAQSQKHLLALPAPALAPAKALLQEDQETSSKESRKLEMV